MRENRQQEIRMDILVDGFRIEQNRRSDADFARICQGYAKAVCSPCRPDA